ncbi:hypothetical protein, partial [Bordetella petrii]|uniref:hypothetical protein n=1 Tax=Bordetella petrii TaxID=94624 RepID=UPI001E4760C7
MTTFSIGRIEDNVGRQADTCRTIEAKDYDLRGVGARLAAVLRGQRLQVVFRGQAGVENHGIHENIL